MQKKFCIQRILKNIAYVLLPIFLIILMFLIFFLTYPLERNSVKQGINYFETTTFAEDYSKEIYSALTAENNLKEYDEFELYGLYFNRTENVSGNENIESINYYTEYNKNNVIWLIIDNDTKIAYTNVLCF